MNVKNMKILVVDSNSLKVIDIIKECVYESSLFDENKLKSIECILNNVDQLYCDNTKVKKYVKKKRKI